MAGGKISEVLANGFTIRESANDGSDFTNPTADYRRLFLGEDGQLHVKDSAGTVTDIGSAAGTIDNGVSQGRLTLTTGVPVTTSDVTAAATLYFTPFNGNRIATYDDVEWHIQVFTQQSLDISGLTTATNYDIFIEDADLSLSAVAWTNATTRATALTTQDGVYVKSGDVSKRYLGTIRMSGSGTSEDSFTKRYVWNAHNRRARPMQCTDATNTWTHNSATWRQANATATDHQLDYVCGLSEDQLEVTLMVRCGVGESIAGAVGIGLDSTSAFSGLCADISGPSVTGAETATYSAGATAHYRGFPGIGYHFFAWLEYARAGTVTFAGDAGVADAQSGMQATVWG